MIELAAFAAGFALAFLMNRRAERKTRREYCVQFRLKRTNDKWEVINWSVGRHKRAREALKSMVEDWTYRQYEYRIATRLLGEWRAR